jgi:hypothetical protein
MSAVFKLNIASPKNELHRKSLNIQQDQIRSWRIFGELLGKSFRCSKKVNRTKKTIW